MSIATVSRVFNHSGVVEESTRERVHAVARELHYFPNAIGRSLSRRRTEAIGLLLPDIFGEFFSEVIRGADETAQQHGYHLLVSSSHSSKGEIAAALKTMRGRVDALVVMSPYIDSDTLHENLPHSVPLILLNCPVQSLGYDALIIDNFGGAFNITMHVLGHGHKRVAIIKGTENNVDATERLRGFTAALQRSGITSEMALQVSGNFSEAAGYDAVKQILSSANRPTAIFASNDAMAIGALKSLRESGVRLPEEMALVGFDDIPVASYLTPSLTSVHVGIHNLGVQAVSTALSAVRLKNAHQKKQVLITTQLSLRQSCGCKINP